MANCIKCGASGRLIKENGIYHCWNCYSLRSPKIDETWRIIKQSLDNDMIWVDIYAEGRRPSKFGRGLRR